MVFFQTRLRKISTWQKFSETWESDFKILFDIFLISVSFRDINLRPTILVIIFWDFLIFYQIFLSPQVKRIAIINNKHGIYELPQELLNDLRLRIFAAGRAFMPAEEKKDLGSYEIRKY